MIEDIQMCKEVSSIGYVKFLDKNKKECFVSPEQLVVGDKSLISQLQDLKDKYNQVLDTNKKLLEENTIIKKQIIDVIELLQKLQKNVEDATTFSMEE